jgi:hypothetical protein
MTTQCPNCQSEVIYGATICKSCKIELGYCDFCKEIKNADEKNCSACDKECEIENTEVENFKCDKRKIVPTGKITYKNYFIVFTVIIVSCLIYGTFIEHGHPKSIMIFDLSSKGIYIENYIKFLRDTQSSYLYWAIFFVGIFLSIHFSFLNKTQKSFLTGSAILITVIALVSIIMYFFEIVIRLPDFVLDYGWVSYFKYTASIIVVLIIIKSLLEKCFSNFIYLVSLTILFSFSITWFSLGGPFTAVSKIIHSFIIVIAAIYYMSYPSRFYRQFLFIATFLFLFQIPDLIIVNLNNGHEYLFFEYTSAFVFLSVNFYFIKRFGLNYVSHSGVPFLPKSLNLIFRGRLESQVNYSESVKKSIKNSSSNNNFALKQNFNGFKSPHSGFVDNKNGTVTDTQTGLMWTKDANPIDERNWKDAVAGAASFSISGVGGWRLASKDELLGLYYASQEGHSFQRIQSSFYWSSTPYTEHPDHSWVICMRNGNLDFDYNMNVYHVWPVRAAQ